MPEQESRERPTRARTAIKTYNLKVLSGLATRTRCKLNKPRQSSPSENENDDMQNGACSRSGGQTHSNASGGLTLPSLTPKLTALGVTD